MFYSFDMTSNVTKLFSLYHQPVKKSFELYANAILRQKITYFSWNFHISQQIQSNSLSFVQQIISESTEQRKFPCTIATSCIFFSITSLILIKIRYVRMSTQKLICLKLSLIYMTIFSIMVSKLDKVAMNFWNFELPFFYFTWTFDLCCSCVFPRTVFL